MNGHIHAYNDRHTVCDNQNFTARQIYCNYWFSFSLRFHCSSPVSFYISFCVARFTNTYTYLLILSFSFAGFLFSPLCYIHRANQTHPHTHMRALNRCRLSVVQFICTRWMQFRVYVGAGVLVVAIYFKWKRRQRQRKKIKKKYI